MSWSVSARGKSDAVGRHLKKELANIKYLKERRRTRSRKRPLH